MQTVHSIGMKPLLCPSLFTESIIIRTSFPSCCDQHATTSAHLHTTSTQLVTEIQHQRCFPLLKYSPRSPLSARSINPNRYERPSAVATKLLSINKAWPSAAKNVESPFIFIFWQQHLSLCPYPLLPNLNMVMPSRGQYHERRAFSLTLILFKIQKTCAATTAPFQAAW